MIPKILTQPANLEIRRWQTLVARGKQQGAKLWVCPICLVWDVIVDEQSAGFLAEDGGVLVLLPRLKVGLVLLGDVVGVNVSRDHQVRAGQRRLHAVVAPAVRVHRRHAPSGTRAADNEALGRVGAERGGVGCSLDIHRSVSSQHGANPEGSKAPYPFRGIVAVIRTDRPLILRSQTIINIDTRRAQFARQQSTEQFFVFQSANAPSASVVHYYEWTAFARRRFRLINSACDLMAIAHGDLMIGLLHAGDVRSYLGTHGGLRVRDPLAKRRYIRKHANIWGLAYGVARSSVSLEHALSPAAADIAYLQLMQPTGR